MLKSFVGYCARIQQFQLREEHGWDTVERCRSLLLHRFERGKGVEGLSWKDDRGAVCGRRHVAEDATKAMEEGWGTANNVSRREEHACPDLVAIVQDGAVGEAGSFGHGGCAGSELDVDDVVVGECGGGDRGRGYAV